MGLWLLIVLHRSWAKKKINGVSSDIPVGPSCTSTVTCNSALVVRGLREL